MKRATSGVSTEKSVRETLEKKSLLRFVTRGTITKKKDGENTDTREADSPQ